MSKSVVIEVTRGPVVESRHEGIAAIVQPDGTVVASWGDIDSLILPRSANKPIQAMAFVESGAVERFGLGDEHIALACASHSGEKRHVETVQAWLAKVGLSEADLECGTHAPRLQGTIEELAREGRMPTAAFNNCSGKHSGFLTTAVQYGEPTKDYIKYNHPVQRRLREVMTDLCGTDANAFPYGTDGCGIPTLATPLKSLARAMANMAEPSRLSNKHAEAAGRIRAAISAEPFMMAGTGRFCTRINAALPGVAQIKTGAEGVFCGMLPTLGFGVAIKMWDGAGARRRSRDGDPAWSSWRAARRPARGDHPSAGEERGRPAGRRDAAGQELAGVTTSVPSRSTSWRSAPAATASPSTRGGATSCPSHCPARRSRPSRATSAARASRPILWKSWRRRAIASRRPARTSRSAAAAPCSIGGATPTPPGRST